MTGIFVPKGYVYGESATVVLYLHGWKLGALRNVAIDRLWNAHFDPRMALREAVQASGKNIVFVAPTLGNRSEAGSLVESDGLDRYHAGVQLCLKAYCGFPQEGNPPALSCKVIACHSGGGIRMRKITGRGDAALDDLAECWGFDCTYNNGDADWWGQWVRAKPHRKGFFYYIANSDTEQHAGKLRDKHLANAVVIASAQHDHMDVPRTYLQDRLRASAALPDIAPLVA